MRRNTKRASGRAKRKYLLAAALAVAAAVLLFWLWAGRSGGFLKKRTPVYLTRGDVLFLPR